jgi:uncharacterized membrane protein YeaQ/YmgE (transglycosylase-associated protein family)
MTAWELLLFLLVAMICGSIARALGGGTRGGCLVSLAVAFIGALLGGKLAQLADLPEPFMLVIGGRSMPVIWSIIGGALFVAVLRLLTGRADRR